MTALNHPAPDLPPQGWIFLYNNEFATAGSPISPLVVCTQTTAGRRDVQFFDLIIVEHRRLGAAPLKNSGGVIDLHASIGGSASPLGQANMSWRQQMHAGSETPSSSFSAAFVLSSWAYCYRFGIFDLLRGEGQQTENRRLR